MRLHKLLAHLVEKDHASALRAVPSAVVEHILKLGLRQMSLRVTPMQIDADLLDGRDWEFCEGCDNFGLPDALHRHADEEGDVLRFCGACHEEQMGGSGTPFDAPEAKP